MRDDIKKGLNSGAFRYLAKAIIVEEFKSAPDAALEFAQESDMSK